MACLGRVIQAAFLELAPLQVLLRPQPVAAPPPGPRHPLMATRLLPPLPGPPQNKSRRLRKDPPDRMRQGLRTTVVKRTRLRPKETSEERIPKKWNLQAAENLKKTRGHGAGRTKQKLRMAVLNSKESLTRERRNRLLKRQDPAKASMIKIKGDLTEKQKGAKRILRLLTTGRANSGRAIGHSLYFDKRAGAHGNIRQADVATASRQRGASAGRGELRVSSRSAGCRIFYGSGISGEIFHPDQPG